MADMKRLGQAGLKGWRAKVGDGAATAVARRTPLDEDQVKALIGVTFFGLAAVYVARTVATLARELRST